MRPCHTICDEAKRTCALAGAAAGTGRQITRVRGTAVAPDGGRCSFERRVAGRTPAQLGTQPPDRLDHPAAGDDSTRDARENEKKLRHYTRLLDLGHA